MLRPSHYPHNVKLVQVALEAVNEGMQKLEGLQAREGECAQLEDHLRTSRRDAERTQEELKQRKEKIDARESDLAQRTRDAVSEAESRARAADEREATLQQLQVRAHIWFY